MLCEIRLNKVLLKGVEQRFAEEMWDVKCWKLRDPNRKGDINTCACMNVCAHLSAHIGLRQEPKERKEEWKGANAGSTSKSFCIREQQQLMCLVQTPL